MFGRFEIPGPATFGSIDTDTYEILLDLAGEFGYISEETNKNSLGCTICADGCCHFSAPSKDVDVDAASEPARMLNGILGSMYEKTGDWLPRGEALDLTYQHSLVRCGEAQRGIEWHFDTDLKNSMRGIIAASFSSPEFAVGSLSRRAKNKLFQARNGPFFDTINFGMHNAVQDLFKRGKLTTLPPESPNTLHGIHEFHLHCSPRNFTADPVMRDFVQVMHTSATKIN